jgi:2-keto-4-pentenoate hydratase
MKSLILGALSLSIAQMATAACPDVSLMQNAARGWLAGQRLPNPLLRNIDDGICAYSAFRGILEAELGPPVGVKLGLVSNSLQERFGGKGPVAGALFAPMLLPDGARISLKGSRAPYFEADLVVTVGSAAIMQATTRDEGAAALRDVRPFIELPDMALQDGIATTAPLLAAYGVMAWRGVLGRGIAMSDLADPVADLGAMTATLKLDGKAMHTVSGEVLMGHPLDVVLWLVQQGSYELKPGSVISLGVLGKLHPAYVGHRIDAEYRIGKRTMRVGATLAP